MRVLTSSGKRLNTINVLIGHDKRPTSSGESTDSCTTLSGVHTCRSGLLIKTGFGYEFLPCLVLSSG